MSMLAKVMRGHALGAVYVLLSACGGGGGGGGGGQPPPPPPVQTTIDLSGRWTVTENGVSNCPGEAAYSATYQISVAMLGGNGISVATPVGTFTGALNGRSLSWRGSYQEQGGTTTINALSATVANDEQSFSGSSNWSWSDGSSSCSGSTQAFVGQKMAAAIPSAPTQLAATPVSAAAIRLNWVDASDNETGFRVERAAAPNGPFTEMAVTAANVATFDATALTASTTYYFRVQANGASGPSGYSNVASATTATLLAAPANLVVVATSSTAVSMNWTDNSANESGFRIERAGAAGAFVEIGRVGTNITANADVNLTPGATYSYRVRAYDASGNSAYSNSAQVTLPGIPNYTLSVQKGGLGTGVASGSGITCGAICTAQHPAGTSITLTATASAGSAFVDWTGCDATSGANCTLDLGANRTVVANFGISASGSFTSVDLPATSSTGTYTLSWTWSGALVSSNWTVQEARDASFTRPVNLTSGDTTSPYELAIANRADGIYCYRIMAPVGNAWSPSRCITVARPTAAVLRIVNNSRYDMIDIRLNNVQQVNYPAGIAVGDAADFTFPGSTTVTYQVGVGFYDANQARDLWFAYSGTVSVTAGQTLTLTAPAVTIGQLLSLFGASHNWDGQYFDANVGLHVARLIFTNGGGWTLQDDFRTLGTGIVTLVSWPDRSPIVTFKLCATCENIQLAYPFGSFTYRNGPPSWPIIDYIAQ